jgi:hypothetical protein
MKNIIFFLLVTLSVHLYAQSNKKEILLIGTFHFNNPGADIAQVNTFDVMNKKIQNELEVIANKISAYKPDKIFVEWEYNKQGKLDSLYNLYVNNNYFKFIEERYPNNKFYRQNETFQLAFRAANKCKQLKVYGIDYRQTSFPFDSLINAIDKANQSSLRKEIDATLKAYEEKENQDRSKLSLIQLLLNLNKQESRNFDIGSYITLFNRAGGKDNFVGAYLVSEWYRRNLYMYALIQKITESKDKRVMVILGASHIAMLKEFIKVDRNFKVVELKDIL